MIRRNWKLLGLCIALAMLAACLFAGSALAEGDAPVFRIDGKTSGIVTGLVNENMHFEIEAPGMTAARIVFANDDWQDGWIFNDWGEWEEDFQPNGRVDIWDYWPNWEDIYTVKALVCYDDIGDDPDWESLNWVPSSEITMVLNTKGDLEAPSFTPSANTSVAWGDTLNIHIDDMGKYFEDPINTDYVKFCAQVMDPSDDYREVFHTNWVGACWDGGENLYIPSVYLEPGHVYAFAVEATVSGYETARSEDVSLYVSGSKPGSDEVSLTLQTSELFVHRQQIAQAYAAGADNVEIVVVNEDGDEVDRRGDGGELTCNTLGDWSDPYTFTVYAEAYYPDGTKKESERQTFSIVADGALDSPEITSMPTVSRVGEPVSFTYTATDADWMYIQLCRIQDGDWITLTDYNEDGTGSGSGTFDGEYFDRPATYVIGVYANAWDKYTGNMSRYFMVVEPSAENSVELTVNGSSDEVVTVQRHEGFSVDVYAPGATAIRILNGHNYDYWWDEPDPEHVHCDWSFPMYNIVFAQACYDEYDSSAEDFNVEDLNWTGFSNVIRVDTTTPNGDLAEPDVTVPETVARGDALVIPINSYQGVDEWYYAEVLAPHYDDEGNSWMEWSNHSDMANDEIRVPTMNLEPGDYTVRIACDAVGFNGNEVRVGFTVEESDYEPQVTAMVDRDSAMSNENFHVYVYAPGADWVEARFRMESDPDWGDDRNGDGEMSDWWLSYDQPDRYLITPVGHYGDEEVFGEPVEFFINCDGWLEPVRANIPAIIHVGEDLSGTFVPVEGAEWYFYDLSIDRGDDWEYFHDGEIRDGNTELFFDGYFFDEPGEYNLSLDAHGYGMGPSFADYRFTVVEEGLEQQVELTANGGTDDLEVLSHQPVTFEVNAPGAKAIRVFFGDHWDYWWDEENPEYVYEDWREFSDGVTAVVAQACYDDYNSGEEGFRVEDLNWTGYSNTIHLNVSSPYGSLDTPTISVPGNVKRGDWLTIHVDPVKNAERYEVYVDAFDENGEYVECRYGNNFYEAGDLQISTESLTGEWSYQLHVSACSEGWHESWTDYYPVEVEQLSPEETRFDISPTEVLTNQAFEVYIMAPGANAVRFCHNEFDNAWNEEWQDFLVVEGGIDRATTWTFYAYATYDEGETWVQIGDPIDVTANADVFLAEPEVTIDPAQPRAGEDVNITVQAVEFCDSIDLEIWNVQDYWNAFYRADERVDGRDSVTFTVPADCFEANHGYVVNVNAHSDREGYSAYVDKRVEFAVNGGEINGTISLDKTEALTSEDLTVTVDVPGATTIQLYLGEDEWRNVLGDHAEESFSRGRPDNYGIFARYSTDPIVTEEWWDSIDWDNFDWNQFNWDGLTNSVNLNVTANGEMEPPQFTIENEDNTVFRGKPLVIRITSDYGRDEWYGAEAFEGDNWYGYTHWNDSTRTIILPTNDLTPGEYELCVSTSAVGYTGSEAFATFTVTVPNVDYFQVYADADNSLIGYDIPFDLYAPGADKVRLNRNGEVWGEWDGEGISEYWSEWGNETYTLTAEALYGSEWRSIGDAFEVTLSSIGTLTAPEQSFDRIVMLGDDFHFSFGETDCEWYKLMMEDTDGSWLVNYDFGEPGDYILTEDMYMSGDRMEAGRIYRADISVWKTGYEPGWVPVEHIAMVDPEQVLTLPAALTEIDEEAFAGTNAQMIVVPNTVTSIGSRAFADCPNLVAVKLPEGASVAEDAFEGCHDELVIVYE